MMMVVIVVIVVMSTTAVTLMMVDCGSPVYTTACYGDNVDDDDPHLS